MVDAKFKSKHNTQEFTQLITLIATLKVWNNAAGDKHSGFRNEAIAWIQGLNPSIDGVWERKH